MKPQTLPTTCPEGHPAKIMESGGTTTTHVKCTVCTWGNVYDNKTGKPYMTEGPRKRTPLV